MVAAHGGAFLAFNRDSLSRFLDTPAGRIWRRGSYNRCGMTPEQIEAGLCDLMRQHDLIFVRCLVHKYGGIEWQAKRRDDCIRTRRNFNELAAAWSVDVTAQAELMEYRLRAGA